MRADCFKIVSQIAADLGGLHHLVNCVAYFGSESLGASEDDWDKTMKVRLGIPPSSDHFDQYHYYHSMSR